MERAIRSLQAAKPGIPAVGCTAGYKGVTWRRERDSNPRSFRTAVFKTAAFDLSAIPPSAATSTPVALANAFSIAPFCGSFNLADLVPCTHTCLRLQQQKLFAGMRHCPYREVHRLIRPAVPQGQQVVVVRRERLP